MKEKINLENHAELKKIGLSFLRFAKPYALSGLDMMVILLSLQCTVAVALKKDKKQLVELLTQLLNEVPADEFYEEEKI